MITREPFPDADQIPVTTCQTGRANEDVERFLRIGGPFTPAQREWCLTVIAAVEGYDRHDYENASDRDLGHGVLSAWAHYCRGEDRREP